MEHRRKTILELLKVKKEVRLNELRGIFPLVSEMTLRRDLDYLALQNLALRTHGGAKLIDDPVEETCEFSERLSENPDAKALIAQQALRLLEPHRSIYIDAGSTMLSFARMIPDMNLYIITNAPNIGLEVMKKSNTEVILLGGSLNKSAISVTGPFALDCLDRVNIDIAFIATGGFSAENAFTNAYTNECELKRKVIARAKKVIVLMDHTKLHRSLPFTFAAIDDIDIIVTDRPLPRELHELMLSKGIRLIIPE